MNRGRTTGANVSWLRRQFTQLAQTEPGFTYGAWQDLCCDDRGHPCVYELFFQMRLLWAQWLRQGDVPAVEPTRLKDEVGLPATVAEALREVGRHYCERRSLARFQRDILRRLQRGEIGLGWVRRQLVCQDDRQPEGPGVVSRDDWESLLTDEEGRSCAADRLFQMHLLFANLYREMSHGNQ